MDIAAWREQIDAIDRQLVELLNRRGHCALEIGRLKRNRDLAIYEPAREKTVLANVRDANHGPLSDRALALIFERIVDEMRAIQRYEALGAANPLADGRSGGSRGDPPAAQPGSGAAPSIPRKDPQP